jgi:hypothetical protein
MGAMAPEKLKVRITESGKEIEVVLYSRRESAIEVVIGEGMNNVKAVLTPTRNGLAYAGSILGREIVYERSQAQVKADIDKLNPALRPSRPR